MKIVLYSCNTKRLPSCQIYVNELTTVSVSWFENGCKLRLGGRLGQSISKLT